jgi:hypothetical protein
MGLLALIFLAAWICFCVASLLFDAGLGSTDFWTPLA